jgi:hypothetical protein
MPESMSTMNPRMFRGTAVLNIGEGDEKPSKKCSALVLWPPCEEEEEEEEEPEEEAVPAEGEAAPKKRGRSAKAKPAEDQEE